ncbi:uncharacterized protein M421DRAFT_164815 [Didymella exigua CBS 183.55]|uniref:DUF1772-domain-containing protein n=1 Tax=Didymella exigua CBS 183.55 TaxID=1150837 RepID=A0A6A5RLH6_9PLEO|nr:uncharacterized protein M421DRAFT_164815 [Didymella exigua CBS 183.55]KAF1927958.1 hypothetical protein M421DRAFT_164815 [Didymella exigua CBS 183.55]
MSATQAIQVLTLSTALFTSGGIAALSAFDIPLIRSQPASRSLPMLRWLFSRGSHTAPTGIMVSSAGFLYLAYAALPSTAQTLGDILVRIVKGRPGLYLAASALSFSAALFTSVAMIPTNFALIQKNENLGGSHSAASSQYREEIGAPPRSAEESVNGKDDVSQWTDVSDPQRKTKRESTEQEDEEVRGLLTKFEMLNYVRAGLIGAGGVVGLVAALA